MISQTTIMRPPNSDQSKKVSQILTNPKLQNHTSFVHFKPIFKEVAALKEGGGWEKKAAEIRLNKHPDFLNTLSASPCFFPSAYSPEDIRLLGAQLTALKTVANTHSDEGIRNDAMEKFTKLFESLQGVVNRNGNIIRRYAGLRETSNILNSGPKIDGVEPTGVRIKVAAAFMPITYVIFNQI